MGDASGSAGMSLRELIEHCLAQGIQQVQAAGSPLHPFLVSDTGTMALLLDPSGQAGPVDMALQALAREPTLRDARRVGLVLDTRITGEDGRKSDAILVIACERDAGDGETWAHCYRPKGLLRRFRAEAQAEKIGGAKNLFEAAAVVA